MATKARQWKNKINPEGADLKLPSGNTALVRQISPTAFLESDLIPDPLSSIIRKAINSNKGLPPSAMGNIANDPKMLGATMKLFDQVLCHVVIEPLVLMPPACTVCGEYEDAEHEGHQFKRGKRDPDVLYADQVEWDDKVHIFNWAIGGTKNLESFRKEADRSMESVPDSQGVRPKTKRRS